MTFVSAARVQLGQRVRITEGRSGVVQGISDDGMGVVLDVIEDDGRWFVLDVSGAHVLSVVE